MQAHERQHSEYDLDPAKAQGGDEHDEDEASGGRPLPGDVRAGMEGSFGADFSGVRVHEDGKAAKVGAQAYAHGSNLHFAPGQFNPGTHSGKELIGHELAHVVQQGQGRVSGAQGKGGINNDASLESEADAMGAAAARGERVSMPGAGSGAGPASIIQGKFIQRKAGAGNSVAPTGAHSAEPGDVIDGYVIFPNEVRHGGTLAWINNNPGNIRPGSFTDSHGAYKGKSNHHFAIFPTEAVGFAAIKSLLGTSTYQSKTILDAMKMYAPPTDGNDPVAYANTIHNLTGLEVTRKVSSLDDSELTKMANAIKRVEGTSPGQTYSRDDKKLPASVLSALGGGGSSGGKEPPAPSKGGANNGGNTTPKGSTQDPGGGGAPSHGGGHQAYSPAPSLADVRAGHGVLKKGVEGPAVKHVQEILHLTADGQFGPNTEAAVKKYQSSHHLTADGEVGKLTLGAMEGHPAGTQPAPGHDNGNHGNAGGGGGHEVPAASGGDPVSIARQYVTHPPTPSIKLKGKLPHFTAAGGETNDCADFVSSVLETAGRISGHHINVSEFERSLVHQGWHYVAKAQAKPGDVWMNTSRGHTELVSGDGAAHLIGSNNDRPGHQVVTETSGWSGIFLHKDFGGSAPAPGHGSGHEGGQQQPAHNGPQQQPGKPGTPAPAGGESGVRDQVLSKAHSHLNAPYSWGAQGPSMFDCSGFSWYVLHTDTHLTSAGRTNAAGLSHAPYTVPTSSPEKGDLVFYAGSGGISHVTIAEGHGTSTIGASGGGSQTHGDNPNAKVKVTDWTRDRRTKSFGSIKKLIDNKLHGGNS